MMSDFSGDLRRNFGASDCTQLPGAASSAMPLSAQNLIFGPSCVGPYHHQFSFSPLMPGGQQPIPVVINADPQKGVDPKQLQKQREFELQRSKLQQIRPKASAATAPPSADAMIAQILGPRGNPLFVPSMPPASRNISQQGVYQHQQNVSQSFAHIPSNAFPQYPPPDLDKTTIAPINHQQDKYVMAEPGQSATDGVFVIPSLAGNGASNRFYSSMPYYPPLPSWTKDKTQIPDAYTKFLYSCIAPGRFDEVPDTSLVYVLLRTSGLSNDILGAIWAIVNRTQPGQLTKEEFFAALSLVAAVQESGMSPSFETLATVRRPSIPRLIVSSLTNAVVSNATNLANSAAALSANIPQSVNGTVPVSNGTSSRGSSDDFGEFTDFVAPPPAEKAVPSDPAPLENFTVNYDVLRALQPALTNDQDVARNEDIVTETVFVDTELDNGGASENFGDFTTAPFAAAAMFPTEQREMTSMKLNESTLTTMTRSRTEPRMAAFHVEKKNIDDLLRQNFESLDLGGGSLHMSVNKSDDETGSISSGTKAPSLRSLDLKSLKSEYGEGVQAPDMTGNATTDNNTRLRSNSFSLVDRYAAIREAENSFAEPATADKHVAVWTKCLEACLRLLSQAVDKFSHVSQTEVCREILGTDRGSKYLCGNVQIYRVAKRIRLALKTTAFQTENLINLLTDIEMAWDNLRTYVAFSDLLPSSDELDFRRAIISGNADESERRLCCGLCLLNVDATCQTNKGTKFDYKLTYGGHQYHAQCANLWINCIDTVLPALDFPALL